MKYYEIKSKIFAAEKILNAQTTTLDRFRSAQELLKDIHPDLDSKLAKVRIYIDKIEKIQKGQIVELSVEHLPEETEEQKKRKKLLLLFLRSWRDLKNEVKRIEHQISSSDLQTTERKESAAYKILSSPKGPLGIITFVAIIIVAGFIVASHRKATVPLIQGLKIQVITVGGQHIRLSDLEIGTGSDCDAPHYHAKDLISVKTVEGGVLTDPGGCGFGKVSDMTVSTMNVPQ